MDFQTAFNMTFGILCAAGGWWLRVLWDAQSSMRADLAALERGLPQTYARRDDVRDLSNAIFERFDRVEAKIDRIAERS